MKTTNFSLITKNGIGRLTFDLEDEKVNKLTTPVMKELNKLLDELKHKREIKVLIFCSAKKDIFIAGADIREIQDISDPSEGENKALMGQAVLNKIEALPFPTISAIDGAALGGGCEFALACTFRIASDNPKTQLGLPEVSLGIIPGFGGTQRLPRLIGVSKAMPLILTGKSIDHKKSEKIGLIDAFYSQAFFDDGVESFAKSIIEGSSEKRIEKRRKKQSFLIDNTPIGRAIVYKKSQASVLKMTKGHLPAPLKAIKAVKYGLKKSLEKGLIVEAQYFSDLVVTDVCKNLIQLFFTGEELKKFSGVRDQVLSKPVTFKNGGVLGAGLMGGGIAWLLSYRGLNVRLKDIGWDAVAKAFHTADKIYSQLVKKRRIKHIMKSVYMNRLSATITNSGFYHSDIIVEAVVENLDIKKSVYSELEPRIKSSAIIASNTSALDITELADGLKNPERFIGMHFFSPVNKMPLVEIIPGEKTSDKTVMETVAFVKQLKKTPIVVSNCPGFLINRILMPYVTEAIKMVSEGVSIKLIDSVAVKFGMPLGPLELADEVGLDVGYKVAKILEDGYGDRMTVDSFFESIHRKKELLGKKSGKGFYIHNSGKKEVNPEISLGKKSNCSASIIEERLFFIMINEAARCIDEGVVDNPRFLDMAMLMGTGFPVFRGGLCRYADTIGASLIVDRLTSLEETCGNRFNPADLLITYRDERKSFY
ncbi:fatty-acid oxidation protein subunit alpha [bacterium]|nr:fatty-acid oxidation protein subunit alpha [bacterium]